MTFDKTGQLPENKLNSYPRPAALRTWVSHGVSHRKRPNDMQSRARKRDMTKDDTEPARDTRKSSSRHTDTPARLGQALAQTPCSRDISEEECGWEEN